MAKGLGAFLVDVVIIFVGIFLMITAYSRKEVLLKLATLGMIRIDPDSPGRTPAPRLWNYRLNASMA